MMLSILYVNENASESDVQRRTFSDILLDKVFSDSILDVLSHPCDSNTIYARQEIFAYLADSKFSFWFDLLYQKIIRAIQIKKAMDDPSITTATKNILFLSYVYAYFEAVKAAENSFESVFLRHLNDWAIRIGKQGENLRERIEEYRHLIYQFSTFGISFRSGTFFLNGSADSSQTVISDMIYQDAKDIGYYCTHKNRCDIKIDNALSDALQEYLPDCFRHMNMIQNDIIPCIDLDLLNLKNEIRFYLDVNIFMSRVRENGIPCCIAQISKSHEFRAVDIFDPSMILNADSNIIPNDLVLNDDCSVSFIRGANGGGKTTFLRAVAANLILFLSGCPILCREASIYPFCRIFTHFPDDEGYTDGGRLENEEKRLQSIITTADNKSFVFLNETFSGSEDTKGAELSIRLMRDLKDSGAFCLFVTHFHQTANSEFHAFVTAMDPYDESIRTYKIVKDSSVNSSYANEILKKYQLDALSLKNRGL